MTQTSLNFLWSTEPPWIYVGMGEKEREKWIPSYFYSRPEGGVCVRRLRGWKMSTLNEFMNEAGAALQLFDGFGENWYALEEMLRYLDEWIPAEAYVIVIDTAEELFSGDEEQLRALFTTFNAAGKFWSEPVDEPVRFQRPPAPFHLLLNLSQGSEEVAKMFARVAADAGVEIRTDPIPVD